MFDASFYPTPQALCRKLIAPLIKTFSGSEYFAGGDKLILEPSAGKGDIVDFICSINCDGYQRKGSARKIYCIERDPSLQYILQGKEYKVIDSDFLSHKSTYPFDLIIANPPFSNGDEHFLKMWEVVKDGGEVYCILNAETVRNPYTEKRKLVSRIIDQYGTTEFYDGEFMTTETERKTAVDIVIVRVKKPEAVEPNEFSFSDTLHEAPIKDLAILTDDDKSQESGLQRSNIVEALVRSYEMAKHNFSVVKQAEDKLVFYSQGLMYSTDILKLYRESGGYVEFLDGFKMQAWQSILKRMNIERFFTSRVQKEFSKNKEQLGFMELTVANIAKVVDMLVQNRDEIMKQCVVDVFDGMTKYHEFNQMVVSGERWKTNKAYFVNKKVILPNYVQWDGYRYQNNYYNDEAYSDIDKVMAYLSGDNYDKIGKIKDSLALKFGQIYKGETDLKETESQYFYIKFFKKGTVHLTFKREELWSRFNQTACEGKMWLGGE